MNITITGEQITSDTSSHSAHVTPDGWTVSWLPGRTLIRNQAITVMVLAEQVSQGATGQDHGGNGLVAGQCLAG